MRDTNKTRMKQGDPISTTRSIWNEGSTIRIIHIIICERSDAENVCYSDYNCFDKLNIIFRLDNSSNQDSDAWTRVWGGWAAGREPLAASDPHGGGPPDCCRPLPACTHRRRPSDGPRRPCRSGRGSGLSFRLPGPFRKLALYPSRQILDFLNLRIFT